MDRIEKFSRGYRPELTWLCLTLRVTVPVSTTSLRRLVTHASGSETSSEDWDSGYMVSHSALLVSYILAYSRCLLCCMLLFFSA